MTEALSTHPEDIKAQLRKLAGSLSRFERENGLGPRSVTDVLMGRRRQSTAEVIAKALGHDVDVLFPGIYVSAVADDSANCGASHYPKSKAA